MTFSVLYNLFSSIGSNLRAEFLYLNSLAVQVSVQASVQAREECRRGRSRVQAMVYILVEMNSLRFCTGDMSI